MSFCSHNYVLGYMIGSGGGTVWRSTSTCSSTPIFTKSVLTVLITSSMTFLYSCAYGSINKTRTLTTSPELDIDRGAFFTECKSYLCDLMSLLYVHTDGPSLIWTIPNISMIWEWACAWMVICKAFPSLSTNLIYTIFHIYNFQRCLTAERRLRMSSMANSIAQRISTRLHRFHAATSPF